MAPIYSLWMARRKPAFYALSEEELKVYDQKTRQAFQDAGGKFHLFCASSWANEQWTGWGVEEFPSVEAKAAYSEGLWEASHIRYTQAWAILGVPVPGTEVQFEAAPVYRAYLVNFTDPWYALSKEQQDEWLVKVTQTHAEFGSKNMLLCMAHWASSEWIYWGIEAYPSMEAMVQRSFKLRDMGWFNYTWAVSLPGTPIS